ncbi:MAG: hypothetical protein WBP11_14310 [Dokdonella sp.]
MHALIVESGVPRNRACVALGVARVFVGNRDDHFAGSLSFRVDENGSYMSYREA